MTVCRLLVPAAICVLMSSCTLSSYPVGDSEQPVEPSEWEGTWGGAFPGEGAIVLIVSVLDAEKGHLGVKWLEEDDGEIKLRESRGFLRATPGMTSDGWGDWLFVSVERKSADANGAVEYVWARVLKESDRALVWVPDSDKLGSLVAEGTLPGTKEGYDVRLGRLESKHTKIIASEEKGVLFLWDAPLVLRRLGKLPSEF